MQVSQSSTHGTEDAFRGTSVPLLAAFTGKYISVSNTLANKKYL